MRRALRPEAGRAASLAAGPSQARRLLPANNVPCVAWRDAAWRDHPVQAPFPARAIVSRLRPDRRAPTPQAYRRPEKRAGRPPDRLENEPSRFPLTPHKAGIRFAI